MAPFEVTSWAELRTLGSVVAVGLALGGLVTSATDRAELAGDPRSSAHECQDTDSARVAQLIEILKRNQPADAGVLERAVYTLNIARRHCLYGWNDIASEQYDWLKHWLDEQK